MNKIIVNIHPFMVNQKLEIFAEDNSSVTSVYCDIDNLTDSIIQAAKEYQCSKVCLKGAYNFCFGYAQKIKNNLFQYNLTKLDVEIL